MLEQLILKKKFKKKESAPIHMYVSYLLIFLQLSSIIVMQKKKFGTLFEATDCYNHGRFKVPMTIIGLRHALKEQT